MRFTTFILENTKYTEPPSLLCFANDWITPKSRYQAAVLPLLLFFFLDFSLVFFFFFYLLNSHSGGLKRKYNQVSRSMFFFLLLIFTAFPSLVPPPPPHTPQYKMYRQNFLQTLPPFHRKICIFILFYCQFPIGNRPWFFVDSPHFLARIFIAFSSSLTQ